MVEEVEEEVVVVEVVVCCDFVRILPSACIPIDVVDRAELADASEIVSLDIKPSTKSFFKFEETT